jgi:four helix bundle protein
MAFEVFEVAVQMVGALRETLLVLGRRDPDLARQVRRAAASVALNIGEGRRRNGKDRIHLWRVAAGSADEVASALRVAEAFGYLERGDVAAALALCDRVLAMLWRLTHPGASPLVTPSRPSPLPSSRARR